jgi:hypothetical protein
MPNAKGSRLRVGPRTHAEARSPACGMSTVCLLNWLVCVLGTVRLRKDRESLCLAPLTHIRTSFPYGMLTLDDPRRPAYSVSLCAKDCFLGGAQKGACVWLCSRTAAFPSLMLTLNDPRRCAASSFGRRYSASE